MCNGKSTQSVSSRGKDVHLRHELKKDVTCVFANRLRIAIHDPVRSIDSNAVNFGCVPMTSSLHILATKSTSGVRVPRDLSGASSEDRSLSSETSNPVVSALAFTRARITFSDAYLKNSDCFRINKREDTCSRCEVQACTCTK